MRFFTVVVGFMLVASVAGAQTGSIGTAKDEPSNNIYTIRQQYLEQVLHNTTEKEENDNDNELARFNRWFHDAEVRTYPSGDLPRPDVLLKAYEQSKQRMKGAKLTGGVSSWTPIGPMTVPLDNLGIGRVNCIVVNPLDTNTLYVGAACGGVFVSHNGGTTWTSNSDQFPSLSIADIAVNPKHPDTLYAATGDGYGYETGSASIFWGGLYSAGVMKSVDGGLHWDTTGLSFLQSDKDIIQKLLINPNNPNVLLAASRTGIYRTADAGATWTNVTTGHAFTMAFYPGQPDTVYAVNESDLIASYDGGVTWSTLYPGINISADRCTIATSAASPKSIWVLDASNNLQWSHDGGLSFDATLTSPEIYAGFYGYYDRVMAVSQHDSNSVFASGMLMVNSTDGCLTWNSLGDIVSTHVDQHAIAFNPLNEQTIYSGNDGGIFVSHDGGHSFFTISNGLMISQIYRMGSSRQHPYTIICGLQDNGTILYDGTNWNSVWGGDGQACAIQQLNDNYQVCSDQYGGFGLSSDGGLSFHYLSITSESGDWTAPVVFDPHNPDTIYFGFQDIFATYDGGFTFQNLTLTEPFPFSSTCLAISQSNPQVLYAGDYSSVYRTTDGGATWTDVTAGLATTFAAITRITVDYSNPMLVYVTFSGYSDGNKVFMSTNGGTTWTNISGTLPNLPVNCFAVDSSVPGAMFAGTDIGVYYKDNAHPDWALYSTGLPNVIVNDLDVNYKNYKIRAATYGRGVWECGLMSSPESVQTVGAEQIKALEVYPNPTTSVWRIIFDKSTPANYNVTVTDASGKTVCGQQNNNTVDASILPAGVYNVDVWTDKDHHSVIKAVRN